MILKCLIRQEMFFFKSVFGGSVAVSSKFLNKHHKRNYHAKYQCCNSLFSLVPALVFKKWPTLPPFLKAQILPRCQCQHRFSFVLCKLSFLYLHWFILIKNAEQLPPKGQISRVGVHFTGQVEGLVHGGEQLDLG